MYIILCTYIFFFSKIMKSICIQISKPESKGVLLQFHFLPLDVNMHPLCVFFVPYDYQRVRWPRYRLCSNDFIRTQHLQSQDTHCFVTQLIVWAQSSKSCVKHHEHVTIWITTTQWGNNKKQYYSFFHMQFEGHYKILTLPWVKVSIQNHWSFSILLFTGKCAIERIWIFDVLLYSTIISFF